MNLKNLDKDMIKKLGIILGSIVAIFVIFVFVKLIIGSRIEYSEVESRMIIAAKNYYKSNADKLPTVSGGKVSVSADTLIENGFLKDLTKLVKDKDAKCTGEVTVTNNNDLLFYSASLNCGKYYETRKLKNVLTENVVTSGNGIYNINGEYIFRGDNVNNFITFADRLWRIIKINDDGSIRIIDVTNYYETSWDDRYNSDLENYEGINDYRVSRLKEKLEEVYNNGELTDDQKSLIVNKNLCVGKRSIDETNNSGSVECSDVVENQPLLLPQPNEFALASLDSKCSKPSDPKCTNYNYMADLKHSTWSAIADSETSYKAFKINKSVFLSRTNNYSYITLVTTINPNVNYVSGDGTENNPYTFK